LRKAPKTSSRPRVPTEASAAGTGVHEGPKLARRPAPASCRASVSTIGAGVADGSAMRTVWVSSKASVRAA